MDKPSPAEYESIEASIAKMLANGGVSYTRAYRSHQIARKIAAHVHGKYHREYLAYVVRLRNGQAVLVVDLAIELPCAEEVAAEAEFTPAKSTRGRRGK